MSRMYHTLLKNGQCHRRAADKPTPAGCEKNVEEYRAWVGIGGVNRSLGDLGRYLIEVRVHASFDVCKYNLIDTLSHGSSLCHRDP